MNLQKILNLKFYLNKFFKCYFFLSNIFFRSITKEKKFLEEQIINFDKINWNYDKSLKFLNKILYENNLDLYDDSKTSMLSQHLVAFAAIKKFNPKKILEIGTYDGQTTFILSKIFPKSQIISFDLNENSTLFNNTYHRNNPEIKKNLLIKRNLNVNQKNIRFIEDNSFNIPKYKLNNFDLIWVDGDHDYPVLSWDICNSYHLLNSNGIMMCDDIFLKKSDTYKIFEYLINNGIIKYKNIYYILKRLSNTYSANPMIRKHIVVIFKE